MAVGGHTTVALTERERERENERGWGELALLLTLE